MMLRLQLLPAASGDCLWLEYGTPPATRVIIIDGGLRETAKNLSERIDVACRERGTERLEVELLVVTHIDNDHILGIIELLKAAPVALRIKDVWFNGRPQLMRLPTPEKRSGRAGRRSAATSRRPLDLMGTVDGQSDAEDSFSDLAALPSPSDLLGPQQADELSEFLAAARLPWNQHPLWNGEAIMVPETGALPVATLDGGLRLTVLGPTLIRLHKLCTAWSDVLGGTDEPSGPIARGPTDLLGRRDSWPPVWNDKEQRDPSAANGSSIMLLAEFEDHALLLAGDGHAPDLATALGRLTRERNPASADLFPLAAFKLPHHGSEKNLTQGVLETIDCSRYLISTDGSTHGHPDHQALLRILRFSRRSPKLLFNYAANTTLPWRDSKSDVVAMGFQDYATQFPANLADGVIVEFD
jgi:hypothetical protein